MSNRDGPTEHDWQEDDWENDNWDEQDEPPLVKCPACGGDVLEMAIQCPECGHYLSSEDAATPLRRGLMVTVIVGLLILISLALALAPAL